jgi:integrase
MGRRRKSNHHLPPRVYQQRNSYIYVSPTGPKETIGKVGEEQEMRRAWATRYGAPDDHGTLSYWLDRYLDEVAKKKAPRSYSDNKVQAEFLRAVFGKMHPASMIPADVREYLDTRGETAPVRANREKALLSHLFTWMMGRRDSGVTTNPCRGVRRNAEKPRERRIEDAEYQKVFDLATAPVKRLMRLMYRTAQRPADCLAAGPRDLVTIERAGVAMRALRFTQGKTGHTVDIVVAGDLEDLIVESSKDKVAGLTFVHTRRGQKFTEDGVAAMFRRYCEKAGVDDFGLRDLRGKAATDMYLAGEPMERIQMLLGHDSITTTERYIKARLPDAVMPNLRGIKSEVPGKLSAL